MTHNQHKSFIDVIDSIIKRERNAQCSSCPPCKLFLNNKSDQVYEINIPRTFNTMKKRYLEVKHGRNCNLPTPKIHELE